MPRNRKLNLPLFIAWRYLFAKKTHNAINIITLVSVTGVAVGAMALVVVLSVFNGFEKLILSLFNSFHPDFEITLIEGKTFSMSDFPADELNSVPGVLNYSEVLEETGLIRYMDRQHLVTLRGADENYAAVTGVDTMLVRGEFLLTHNERDYLVLGQGVSLVVNASIHDLLNPIEVYLPRRGRTAGLHPSQAFRSSAGFAGGVFAVQSEYDMEYVIAPVRLMRRLLDYEDQVSSLFVSTDPSYNYRVIHEQIQEIAGPGYLVRNRLQQQDFLYRIMRSEKWAIFLILSFILVIAAFNIVGSLTMLVIEKRRDIPVLRSMGAARNTIGKVFLMEGVLISLAGAVFGITAGGLISWLQMKYGLISLQGEGVFIVDAYPVSVELTDLLLVGVTVFCIGILASLLPLRRIRAYTEKPPSD